MTSTARNRRDRRRPERTPAVVVSPELAAEHDLPAVRHGLRDTPINWRIFSLLIVVCLSVVLFLFFSADVFYVRAIYVSGTRHLEESEIFRLAEIAETHVFWIDPTQVRERILQFPAVADAQISLHWPPNMVRIAITEREPSLVWTQSGISAWVDIHGNVLMAPPENRPDLLTITTVGIDSPIRISDKIPQDVVDGARQLRELVPNTPNLVYDTIKGLGFTNADGANVWFGSGRNMPMKILIYKSLMNDLNTKGVKPVEINLVNPHAPYYCEAAFSCG